jgi:hypothetical protein
MAYSVRLPKPLPVKDHEPLQTLADARVYILALPEAVASQSAWQAAARLLMEAAAEPDTVRIGAAARQIERALFVSYRLDLSKGTTSPDRAGTSKTARNSSRSASSTPARTKAP